MSGKRRKQMNDVAKKEPLKLVAKQPEQIKLGDTEPFWNGTDNYGKPKYGFKIIHISGADAMFVSAAVKLIIDQSGVRSGEEFTLLLDQGTNGEGQPINFWTLDKNDGIGAKTANQWAEYDSPEAVIADPEPQTENPRRETRSENLFDVSDQLKALEIRVAKLEEKSNKITQDGTEGLPF